MTTNNPPPTNNDSPRQPNWGRERSSSHEERGNRWQHPNTHQLQHQQQHGGYPSPHRHHQHHHYHHHRSHNQQPQHRHVPQQQHAHARSRPYQQQQQQPASTAHHHPGRRPHHTSSEQQQHHATAPAPPPPEQPPPPPPQQQQQHPTDQSPPPPPPVPRKPKLYWRKTVDRSNNKPYYYHTQTKQVTWDKPAEMVQEEKEKEAWMRATAHYRHVNEQKAAEWYREAERRRSSSNSHKSSTSSTHEAAIAVAQEEETTRDTKVDGSSNNNNKDQTIPLRRPSHKEDCEGSRPDASAATQLSSSTTTQPKQQKQKKQWESDDMEDSEEDEEGGEKEKKMNQATNTASFSSQTHQQQHQAPQRMDLPAHSSTQKKPIASKKPSPPAVTTEKTSKDVARASSTKSPSSNAPQLSSKTHPKTSLEASRHQSEPSLSSSAANRSSATAKTALASGAAPVPRPSDNARATTTIPDQKVSDNWTTLKDAERQLNEWMQQHDIRLQQLSVQQHLLTQTLRKTTYSNTSLNNLLNDETRHQLEKERDEILGEQQTLQLEKEALQKKVLRARHAEEQSALFIQPRSKTTTAPAETKEQTVKPSLPDPPKDVSTEGNVRKSDQEPRKKSLPSLETTNTPLPEPTPAPAPVAPQTSAEETNVQPPHESTEVESTTTGTDAAKQPELHATTTAVSTVFVSDKTSSEPHTKPSPSEPKDPKPQVQARAAPPKDTEPPPGKASPPKEMVHPTQGESELPSTKKAAPPKETVPQVQAEATPQNDTVRANEGTTDIDTPKMHENKDLVPTARLAAAERKTEMAESKETNQWNPNAATAAKDATKKATPTNKVNSAEQSLEPTLKNQRLAEDRKDSDQSAPLPKESQAVPEVLPAEPVHNSLPSATQQCIPEEKKPNDDARPEDAFSAGVLKRQMLTIDVFTVGNHPETSEEKQAQVRATGVAEERRSVSQQQNSSLEQTSEALLSSSTVQSGDASTTHHQGPAPMDVSDTPGAEKQKTTTEQDASTLPVPPEKGSVSVAASSEHDSVTTGNELSLVDSPAQTTLPLGKRQKEQLSQAAEDVSPAARADSSPKEPKEAEIEGTPLKHALFTTKKTKKKEMEGESAAKKKKDETPTVENTTNQEKNYSETPANSRNKTSTKPPKAKKRRHKESSLDEPKSSHKQARVFDEAAGRAKLKGIKKVFVRCGGSRVNRYFKCAMRGVGMLVVGDEAKMFGALPTSLKGETELQTISYETTRALASSLELYPSEWNPDERELERFSRDVVIPTLGEIGIVGENRSITPGIFGTLLLLREFLIRQAPSVLKEDATTLIDAAAIFSLEKLEKGELHSKLVRLMDSFDDGSSDCAMLLRQG